MMWPLEKSIAILNANKHNFEGGHVEDHHTLEWELSEGAAVLVRYITEYKDIPWSRCEDHYQWLTPFEASAIAKAYENLSNE